MIPSGDIYNDTISRMGEQCEVYRLGCIPYTQAWQLQKRLAEERAASMRPDCLLLLEHPHTFTLGRSAHVEHLLLTEDELKERGIEMHWVDRGGDITYHGPGQLVGYPIMALGKPQNDHCHIPQADYVGYVRNLEAMIIRTITCFGLATGQIKGLTGVWVQPDIVARCSHCPPDARKAPAKIASIGVKVNRHGISQHGFALNLSPEMAHFSEIVACGLREHCSISMAELLLDPPNMAAVQDTLTTEFGIEFSREMITAEFDPNHLTQQHWQSVGKHQVIARTHLTSTNQ